MHDVGKIGIPETILQKPGKLTPEEYEEMKKHTLLGAHIFDGAEASLLKTSATVALTHHERYDGSGYPRGLKGSEIPIEGQIIALADVFDALSSPRCYKPAYPIERCLEIIRGECAHHSPSGRHPGIHEPSGRGAGHSEPIHPGRQHGTATRIIPDRPSQYYITPRSFMRASVLRTMSSMPAASGDGKPYSQ